MSGKEDTVMWLPLQKTLSLCASNHVCLIKSLGFISAPIIPPLMNMCTVLSYNAK